MVFLSFVYRFLTNFAFMALVYFSLNFMEKYQNRAILAILVLVYSGMRAASTLRAFYFFGKIEKLEAETKRLQGPINDGSGGTVHRFASPKIAAVDTLNAGDVWHGTYAYGLVHGWAFERTIRAASVAAAIKCERFGGRAGSPTLPELLRRLQEWERITPNNGQAGA